MLVTALPFYPAVLLRPTHHGEVLRGAEPQHAADAGQQALQGVCGWVVVWVVVVVWGGDRKCAYSVHGCKCSTQP